MDLEEYSITPTKLINMTIKNVRYEDHATYLVYYPKSSNITLEIIQKAYVIRSTIVKWDHYRPGGDGIPCCSNCSQLGHSGNCTLDPKCGICSGAHIMAECEHLLNKRVYKRESIAEHLLKCPNCDEKHWAGFLEWQARLDFTEKRLEREEKQRQRYIDAPPQQTNHWSRAKTPRNNNHNNKPQQANGNRQFNKAPAVFTNPNYNTTPMPSINYNQTNGNTQSTSNNNQNNNSQRQEKFSPGEVVQLLNQIITCLDTCNTRAEQFQVMSNILTDHFFKWILITLVNSK